MAKIRFVENIVSSITSATSTATGFDKDNLNTLFKSEKWRSTTDAQQDIVVSFGSTKTFNCVIFCNTNFTSDAQLKGYTGGSFIDCCAFTYDGVNYAAIYFADQSASSTTISISDSLNPDNYLEAGAVIIGDYQELAYNFDYGALIDIIDTTKTQKNDNGDTIVNRGVKYKKFTFNLNNMNLQDRQIMMNYKHKLGSHTPLFISLYPEHDNASFEQDGMIYGYFKSAGVAHKYLNASGQNLVVEEI